MLTTTYNLAVKAFACPRNLYKAVEHYGGVKKYGADTPVPLTEIADICGIDDALWCLCCTREKVRTKRLARLLAADFAEHVLHFYEEKYPDDGRPRRAIEATRLYVHGKIRAAAWGAARDAAWDAARDAARDAAWAAAWAAARAAARGAAGAAARGAARGAAMGAARGAAMGATWAAAIDAAIDAARGAAGAAEREWQLERFKEVLKG